MLDFYTSAVKYGYMTIEEVPERYQEDVASKLAAPEQV
jgi:hypothetical protein